MCVRILTLLYSAMVGAPQAEASPFTIPGVRTPGAVYQCPLQANQATSSDCSQIRIDTERKSSNFIVLLLLKPQYSVVIT